MADHHHSSMGEGQGRDELFNKQADGELKLLK